MHPEHRMKSCPSYVGCAAPICPLETVYPSKERFKLEGEADCIANKSTRMKLGQNLKFLGLTKREHAGWLVSQSFKESEANG